MLTNFKHLFDLAIIKIIIPLYNTISTIVFEGRETMNIALHLSLFREKNCHKILLVGTVVVFKNIYCLFAGFYMH